ncbi:MAG: DUF3368 domain-containing protein [Chloroflexi bacterium]|nr:DUF3368 domain-containing protein [Chloroflexota bacterium]
MSNPSSSHPVLLDNTVLSNFAKVDRSDLALGLWSTCATTLETWQEYIIGLAIGKLQKNAWKSLEIVELNPSEHEFAASLSIALGAGERTCIAVAKHRQGLFVTDDRKARQVALELAIKVTGTLGILVVAIERKKCTLKDANDTLAKMIQLGYHSPVDDLKELL